MVVTCVNCKLTYDDAECLTFCPHAALAPKEVLNRKDQAYKVFDSKKKYRVKETDLVGRVTSIDHLGYVSLSSGSMWITYDPFTLEEVKE